MVNRIGSVQDITKLHMDQRSVGTVVTGYVTY